MLIYEISNYSNSFNFIQFLINFFDFTRLVETRVGLFDQNMGSKIKENNEAPSKNTKNRLKWTKLDNVVDSYESIPSQRVYESDRV